MDKKLKFILLLICFSKFLLAQNKSQSDSLIKELMKDHVTPISDPGVSLIKGGEYESANKYLSAEITKDESDRSAYFKRGVANWALSDTLSACRDWSAVLALGDTEMFNLLDSKCHGSMIISDDTIPSKQYHKMWAQKKGDATQNAKTVVEEMPSFPGGEDKLFAYMSDNKLKNNSGRHGTIYVNFLISPKGKILYPYVAHGSKDALEKDAIRVVRNMPDWKPGKQKGKAVFVRSSLPVRY